MSETLFDDDGLRVTPAVHAEMTAGQRLRARQAQRIARGRHPLSDGLHLHPDAPRNAEKDDARIYPRCGSCTYREVVSGEHAGRFPKCMFGYDGRRSSSAFRATNGAASDVRAWWPACVDYAPAETS